MAEIDDMIDEIVEWNSGTEVLCPNIWPNRIEDIAYIGDRRSPYDEGEHHKKALMILRRDIRSDDLKRFHDVESILIIDTLIDERLSLNHFVTVKELKIVNIQFGETFPDFGPIRDIDLHLNNRDGADPEVKIILEKLLASTSKSDMELSVFLLWSGDFVFDRWLGKVLRLIAHPDTLDDVTFRLSNCPGLERLRWWGFCVGNCHATLSNLPRLESLETFNGPSRIEIEDEMVSLKNICLSRQQQKDGSLVGLENCCSLRSLQLNGYNLPDLRTISQNSEMKKINASFSNLSSLTGVEYLHKLEHLVIVETPLAHEIQENLQENELDAVRTLLFLVDLRKARITTRMGQVDDLLMEFADSSF